MAEQPKRRLPAHIAEELQEAQTRVYARHADVTQARAELFPLEAALAEATADLNKVITSLLTVRVVKVNGVLTEGDANTAREALRQMDADPHGLKAGMIVQPYTERGESRWVFRCWGTDTCDGWLSLDHMTRTSAESARDRHVAEAHRETSERPQ